MKKIKFVVVFTVLMNVIGMGIIIPVLPHYVESFHTSAFTVTLLFGVFAFCSFISSPFLGALSDRIGRRPILIISILSTAIGWLVFASARSLIFLFIGRIIDGMAAGNISTAQSSLVDISKDPKERTRNLGLIGAAFGIGFIVGPLIGGLLSSFSPVVPFWFATALAFIDVIIAFLFLDETHKHINRNAKLEWNPFLPLKRAITKRTLLPNYFAWFFFIMAVSSFQSTFALYLDQAFGVGPFGAGLLFTLIGTIIALNQMVALKHFWLKYFSEAGIELWMVLILGGSFFVMGVPFFALFVFGIVATGFGQSILRPVMTSRIVGKSPKEAQGEIIGVTSSIQSVGMTLSPVIAGAVFSFKGNLPFFLSGCYLLTAFFIILLNRRRTARIEAI
jgi:MFS family permease